MADNFFCVTLIFKEASLYGRVTMNERAQSRVTGMGRPQGEKLLG